MTTKQELEQKAVHLRDALLEAEGEYIQAMKLKRLAKQRASTALKQATRVKIQYMRVMGSIEACDNE